MNLDNRKRALNEVVSLDAWHKGFTKSRKASDLHVDVTFSEGRIGEDSDSNVRFRLSLKQAQIVVVVPPNEPAKVQVATVRREDKDVKVKTEKVLTSKNKGNIGLSANADAGANQLNASVKAGVEISSEALRLKTIKILEKAYAMTATQFRTRDEHYAWRIEPAAENILNGKPWNATREPRMKIEDTRADREKGIEPSIRVEIRCRREDFEIRDIMYKNGGTWGNLLEHHFNQNKILAAQAVIRTRLFESGLLHGELSDPFAEITICAIISEVS
ncbi:hypothetical protein [Methylobacterium sp. 88A]|uniref:hypothetical protein n=1 Tax=Methylobacterium sp. 88A TaxID=1131813 RepID=UPI0012F65D30|nr:hypothetical protein [Methylobacterium sp. 88A]